MNLQQKEEEGEGKVDTLLNIFRLAVELTGK